MARGHNTTRSSEPVSFFLFFLNRAACLCATRFKRSSIDSPVRVCTRVTYTAGHSREIRFTEGEVFPRPRDRATRDTREGQRHGQTHRARIERERERERGRNFVGKSFTTNRGRGKCFNDVWARKRKRGNGAMQRGAAEKRDE